MTTNLVFPPCFACGKTLTEIETRSVLPTTDPQDIICDLCEKDRDQEAANLGRVDFVDMQRYAELIPDPGTDSTRGFRIRIERLKRKITLKQEAARLGVSMRTLAEIENGDLEPLEGQPK
jgi:hypothetical protein